MNPAERVVVRLDDSPWGEIYRFGIGFVLVPAASLIWGPDVSGLKLGATLLAVLFALRAGTAVTRKLLPFSNEALELWKSRRLIAKRCDSYMWRKLLWTGLGLSAYFIVAGRFTIGQLAVAMICVTAGGAALLVWQLFNAENERVRWQRRGRGLA